MQEYERKEKARAQEDKKRARTTDMESVLASPGVTPNMAAHARTIHMYEDITGIKITPRPTDSRSSPNIAVWDLEHTGNFGSMCTTFLSECCYQIQLILNDVPQFWFFFFVRH